MSYGGAGGSGRAVEGAVWEHAWLGGAAGTGMGTNRDHDARLLREINTASTNYEGTVSPSKGEPVSEGHIGLSFDGGKQRLDADGLQKAAAAAGLSLSEHSQTLGSPRKQRLRRLHAQPIHSV